MFDTSTNLSARSAVTGAPQGAAVVGSDVFATVKRAIATDKDKVFKIPASSLPTPPPPFDCDKEAAELARDKADLEVSRAEVDALLEKGRAIVRLDRAASHWQSIDRAKKEIGPDYELAKLIVDAGESLVEARMRLLAAQGCPGFKSKARSPGAGPAVASGSKPAATLEERLDSAANTLKKKASPFAKASKGCKKQLAKEFLAGLAARRARLLSAAASRALALLQSAAGATSAPGALAILTPAVADYQALDSSNASAATKTGAKTKKLKKARRKAGCGKAL